MRNFQCPYVLWSSSSFTIDGNFCLSCKLCGCHGIGVQTEKWEKPLRLHSSSPAFYLIRINSFRAQSIEKKQVLEKCHRFHRVITYVSWFGSNWHIGSRLQSWLFLHLYIITWMLRMCSNTGLRRNHCTLLFLFLIQMWHFLSKSLIPG